MHEPTYRQALAQAWHVTWHNKILWIFGLLSIFLGQFGFSDLFGKLWLITSGKGGGISIVLPWFSLTWPAGNWGIVSAVWIGIIVLCLGLVMAFLAITSQGALISYASERFKNKNYSNISKSWASGLHNFWRIAGIQIIRKILMVVLLGVFAYVLSNFLASSNAAVSIIFACVLVLVLFLSLFLSIMVVYTLCYTIIDSKGLISSLGKAWDLLSRHVLVSFEVGFLLMLFNFVLITFIIFGSFLAFLPSIFIWLAAGITNMMGLVTLGFVLGIFLWVVLVVFAAAFFNAFTTSTWVYLFSKMHHEGIASRVVHWFKHLV